MKHVKVVSLMSILLLLVNPILPSVTASANSMFSQDEGKFTIQQVDHSQDSIQWKVTMLVEEGTEDSSTASINFGNGLSYGQVLSKTHNGSTSNFDVHQSGSGYQVNLPVDPGLYQMTFTTAIINQEVANFKFKVDGSYQGVTAFDEVKIVPDMNVELTIQQKWIGVPDDVNLPSVEYQIHDASGNVAQDKAISGEESSFKFTSLPKYTTDGTLIQYSPVSLPVDNFETERNGNVFTHTYMAPKEKDTSNQDNESGQSGEEETKEDSDPDPAEDEKEEQSSNEDELEEEANDSTEQQESEESTNEKSEKNKSEDKDLESELDEKDTEESETQDSSQSKDDYTVMNHDELNEYHVDTGGIVNATELSGSSTNKHTYPELIWSYQGTVYLAVESTHGVEGVSINGVSSIDIDHFSPGVDIIVDQTTYAHTDPQGNTDDAHWSVAKFNIADLELTDGGLFDIIIDSNVGGGHDVDGHFEVVVPKGDKVGEKVWSGEGPKSAITLKLIHSSTNVEPVVIDSGVVDGSEDEAWTYIWENVNLYDSYGQPYSFSVDEEDVPVNYEKTLDGMKVINTYNPEKISIDVKKEWIGDKAESATFELLVNGDKVDELTLNSEPWEGSFNNLNKFDDQGDPIAYNVQEKEITNFTSERTGSIEEGFTFTNINVSTTSINVLKEWDGTIAGPIDVQLYKNQEPFGNTITLNDENDWSHTFSGLRKFDPVTGEVNDYDVEEIGVPEGYKVTYSNDNTGDIRILNTHLEGGKVTVEYVDLDGNVLDEGIEKTGMFGEAYNTEEKDITGYRFVKLADESASASGTFTLEPQTVTYVYEKILGSLTVEKTNQLGDLITSDSATFRLESLDTLSDYEETLTTSNGKAEFENLELGTYLLYEEKAPEGFSKRTQPIEIVISESGDSEDDNGEHAVEVVTNSPIGWEIPETGGVGANGFYLVGTLLMLAAGYVLWRRKRQAHD
ncbi:Cna B-type domain-containing protein [Alkalibacillus sp. S2W]|uniref:Cna B-type domain-containing protein n=1 Tax=Alkalibacillus sp. S2W TaxID=3386553 RepID=UPI00398C9560